MEEFYEIEILLHRYMKYILRILYMPTHLACIQTLLKRSDVFVHQSGPWAVSRYTSKSHLWALPHCNLILEFSKYHLFALVETVLSKRPTGLVGLNQVLFCPFKRQTARCAKDKRTVCPFLCLKVDTKWDTSPEKSDRDRVHKKSALKRETERRWGHTFW